MTSVGLAGLVSGLTLGLAMPQVYGAVFPPEPPDDPPNLLRMQKDYRLDNDQMRLIRAVLRDRDAKVVTIVVAGGQLPVGMEESITQVRRHADDRIYAVLDSKQRKLYRNDLESSGAVTKPKTKKK